MKKTVRVFEMGQGKADNIQPVEKVTLVVHSIDERNHRVFFTVNPSITGYQETQKKQSIEYEATNDSRLGKMTPSDPPFFITIEGTKYQIAVLSIGTTQDPLHRAYCDFEVSRDE